MTEDEWVTFGVPDGATLLDPDRSIAARPTPGGPSPASVLAQCEALEALIGPDRARGAAGEAGGAPR
jgi:hypothetical protein